MCGVCLLALSPPGHQFKQGWSFFLVRLLTARQANHILKSPYHLLCQSSCSGHHNFYFAHDKMWLSPEHAKLVSAKALQNWQQFLSCTWPWPVPQHWDGAAQDKQQLLGSTWNHPNWVRQNPPPSFQQHQGSSEGRAELQGVSRELDETRACWFRAALQRFQHPGEHHFTALRQNLCQMAQNVKGACSKLNKTSTFPPRKPNTKKKSFKRLLTANLKNKEQEQKATIAQMLCLDGVVWNNVFPVT